MPLQHDDPESAPVKPLATCVLLLLSLTIAGCGSIGFAGGSDRSNLARGTIVTYWTDINHAKMNQAYSMLTPGVREGITVADFQNNFVSLLTRAGSIGVKVDSVQVHGDNATAKVTLSSPKDHPLHAWQHLFWVNGSWHISDNNAFLSQQQ
jgi:hypothetical protein